MPAQEGEKLLRVAILSRALRVQPTDRIPQSLVHRRKLLARSLRERRKKGVIPVFGKVVLPQSRLTFELSLVS